MNLRIVFKLILYTQAKNVAETVTALMTNLAIAAAVSVSNQIPVMNPCKDVSKRKGLKH